MLVFMTYERMKKNLMRFLIALIVVAAGIGVGLYAQHLNTQSSNYSSYNDSNLESNSTEAPKIAIKEEAPFDLRFKDSNSLYTYKKLNNTDLLVGTSHILSTSLANGTGTAQFRGALITLFGAPILKSDNAEEAYDYIIHAQDTSGHQWILTAYEGPSGPAIGGDSTDHSIYPVAKDLLKTIEATKPSVFEEKTYYEDFGNTIVYGCTQTKCYYSEHSPNSTK